MVTKIIKQNKQQSQLQVIPQALTQFLTMEETPIPEEFKLIHRYWQASNYLSVGQVRSSTSYLITGRETYRYNFSHFQ
jgi:hypothetical protein